MLPIHAPIVMLFDYNQIIPGRLWVGAFVRPEDAKQLQRMGITIVVSLQSDQDFKQNGISLKKLLRALEDANIDLRRVPVEDFDKRGLAGKLPACIAEIEAALAPGWAKVYVHCSAGINRSPTAAAAYLMKSRGLSAQEAHDYLVERRDCNPYLDVLEEYETELSREK
jgi:protein-tyrosine phosphatase